MVVALLTRLNSSGTRLNYESTRSIESLFQHFGETTPPPPETTGEADSRVRESEDRRDGTDARFKNTLAIHAGWGGGKGRDIDDGEQQVALHHVRDGSED
jgi:hypothetical protein